MRYIHILALNFVESSNPRARETDYRYYYLFRTDINLHHPIYRRGHVPPIDWSLIIRLFYRMAKFYRIKGIHNNSTELTAYLMKSVIYG